MSIMGGPEQFEQAAATPDLYERLADEMLPYDGGPPVSLRTLGAFCPLDLEALPVEDKNKWIVDAYNQFEGTVPAELADYFTVVSTELNQEPHFRVADTAPEIVPKPDAVSETRTHTTEAAHQQRESEMFVEPVQIEQHVMQNRLIMEVLEYVDVETPLSPEQDMPSMDVATELVATPLETVDLARPSVASTAFTEVSLHDRPDSGTITLHTPDTVVQAGSVPILAEMHQIETVVQAETPHFQAEATPVVYMELPAPSFAMHEEDQMIEPTVTTHVSEQLIQAENETNAVPHIEYQVEDMTMAPPSEQWAEVLQEEPEIALMTVHAVLQEYVSRQYEDNTEAPPIVKTVSLRMAELSETERVEVAPLMQNIIGAIHGLELLRERGEDDVVIAAVQAKLEALCIELFEELRIPYQQTDIAAFLAVLQSEELTTILVEKRGTHEVKLFLKNIVKDPIGAADRGVHGLLGMIAVRPFSKPLMVH